MCEELVKSSFNGNFYHIDSIEKYLSLCNELSVRGITDIFPVQRMVINGAIKDFHHAGVSYDESNSLRALDCLSLGPYKCVEVRSKYDFEKIISDSVNKCCHDVSAVIVYMQFIVDTYHNTNNEDQIVIDSDALARLFLGISTKLSDEVPSVTSSMERLPITKVYYNSALHRYGVSEDGINNVQLILGFSRM